ncbi:MAG: nucleotidyltransferase domain-containing protein [Oceanospirillaceae bacterium]|nr:nucleotidyltransferase domain-containing protein [Oceanospirillaceae bacterium]
MKTELAPSGLTNGIIGKLHRIFDSYQKLDTVILYGSRALGTYKMGSDIDLTFIGNGLGFNDILNLEAELDDLMTPYSFDISIFDQLDNPQLIEHINRVGVVFYERDAKLEDRS